MTTTTATEERPTEEAEQEKPDAPGEAQPDAAQEAAAAATAALNGEPEQPSDEVKHGVVERAAGHGLLTIEPGQNRFTPEQLTALASIGIETGGPNAVPVPHIMQFFHVCQAAGFDPFRREAYLITHGKRRQLANGDVVDNRKFTLVVGIDGFRSKAESTNTYGGTTAPQWCGNDGVWREFWNSRLSGPPVAARIGVYRKGFHEPVYGVAMYDEFVPLVDEWEGSGNNRQKTGEKVPTEMWAKMPANQLVKCAEAQAMRRAFPRHFAGVYAVEEMERAKVEYEQDQEEQARQAAQQRQRRATAYQAATAHAASGTALEGKVVETGPRPGADDPAPVGKVARTVVAEVAAKADTQGERPAEQASEAQGDPFLAPEGLDSEPPRQLSEDETRAALLAEAEAMARLLGTAPGVLFKREIRMHDGAPATEWPVADLLVAVAKYRKTVAGTLAKAGHQDKSEAYAAVDPAAVVVDLAAVGLA